MADIYWDRFAVPHIVASNRSDLFRAFGWCQMRNHGNLVLKLYGTARGRAAEYWGPTYRHTDYWTRLMGIPARAETWLAQQEDGFRQCLDAFVEGMNKYAAAHPQNLTEEVRQVLPVTSSDVLAHSQRLINFAFVMDAGDVASTIKARQKNRHEGEAEKRPPLGSNAWAVSPQQAVSGHAILLANPHLPWSDMFRLFEAHLSAPNINLYGVTMVGLPVLTIAFNHALGWAHTVNAYRGWVVNELELTSGGYRSGGAVGTFDERVETIRIRQADGTLQDETVRMRQCRHGPVISVDAGRAYTLEVAGLESPRALEQWWSMGTAGDYTAFEKALCAMQIPMFTILYADRTGRIMHHFNARVPIRRRTDDITVDGLRLNGPDALFSDRPFLEFGDLPHIENPATGWLHNANDPPWSTTFPPVLDQNLYPDYVAPQEAISLRAQRSIKMLMQSGRLSVADVVDCKFSTLMELAERLRDPLVALAEKSDQELVNRAGQVLRNWDCKAEPGSRGAVLFAFWAHAAVDSEFFEAPWRADEPITTPRGIANPEHALSALARAANRVASQYGSLDVEWQEVFRLTAQAGTPSTQITGENLGIFQEIWFTPARDGRFDAAGGDCYAAVIEFSDRIQAKVILIYGNATQEGIAGGGDQIDLYRKKAMRTAWLTHDEIIANLELHERCE